MEILKFALLGLAVGSLYAMAAQGIVLIYRASGVVNFAQGAFVMVGGYSYYELNAVHKIPAVPALIGTLGVGIVLGLLVHYLVMRPMRSVSPIARVVATLGIFEVLQAIAVLRYGQNVENVNSMFPTHPLHIAGAIITQDRLILFFVGLATTIMLWAIYKFSSFGQVTSAVAENELAAASLGRSPDLIAAINWASGAALATVTGALIAPITTLQSTQTSLVILPALAAALLGGFASFPLAFLAALLVGVGQSVMTYEDSVHMWWPGWSQSIPFLLVIAYLVVRGKGIPLRSHLFDRLPKVGSGHIRKAPMVALAAVGLVLIATLPQEWSSALTITLCFGIVCLSVIVVTGYAGQLSLAQLVIGAMGAFIGAKLMQGQGVPFDLAFLIGVLSAMLIGLVLGAPALRTRGINLAVVTLGIAISINALFLTNPSLIGGLDGIAIKPASLFGLDLNPETHPARYGATTLVILVLLTLMVANLRRGAAGRRLLAVRSNERAALALGVSVYTAKLYSFMMSAGIAAVGVSLLAFINTKVVFSQFDVFSSINFVTASVVGGLGMLPGSLIGSLLIQGGISSRLLSDINNTVDTYLPLIGGLLVLVVVRMGGDGIFEKNRQLALLVLGKIRSGGENGRTPRGLVMREAAAPATERPQVPLRHRQPPAGEPLQVVARTLFVHDISVSFGGVNAVKDMSLTVHPRTVHGLIGPNGAGKTTLIDAITGFVQVSKGSIALQEIPVDRVGARRRARRGIARSFQSGELFNDLTVRENLAVGSDDGALSRYAVDLIRPGKIRLSDAAQLAAHAFELDDAFDLMPEDLPFGRRRLVGIARAIASTPSILLLDEPASGLDSRESEEVAQLIRMIADEWGIGILLVEHNLDMVFGVCDEVTVMASGTQLLPASPPDVVRAHPDVIAAYVGNATPANETLV